MKSEPEEFSIDDLRKIGTSPWEGVRNYQARNFMVQDMKPGDLILFYHSNAEPTGVAGLAKVASEPIVDPTQFDKKSDYHDPKSKKEEPRWRCVKVSYVDHFENFVTLAEMREEAPLKKMLLLQKGQRLSVQPVRPKEFAHILKMGQPKKGTP